MSIAKMLASIAKDGRERALGRIHSLPGNWVFSETAPAPKTEADAQSRFPRPDADGCEMVIINQRAVTCSNGEMWQDRVPRTTRGETSFWWVPRHKCARCEHYRKSGYKGVAKFPRCMFDATAATKHDAALQGLTSAADAIKEANSFARKITRT